MGRPRKIKEDSNVDVIDDPLAPVKTLDPEYKIEVIKDYDGKVDVFYISQKDPNYEYRFIRFEPKNMSLKTGNILFQSGGWQPVSKEHCLRIGIKDQQMNPDGLYHVGDQVLAFMPKELYKEKEAYKQERANAPLRSIERLIKEGDPTKGGKEIHGSMKGIQTEDQLRGNFKP
jgi:hypothetical protein